MSRPGGLGVVPQPWLLPAGGGGGGGSRSVRLRGFCGLHFGAWRRDTQGGSGGHGAKVRGPARAARVQSASRRAGSAGGWGGRVERRHTVPLRGRQRTDRPRYGWASGQGSRAGGTRLWGDGCREEELGRLTPRFGGRLRPHCGSSPLPWSVLSLSPPVFTCVPAGGCDRLKLGLLSFGFCSSCGIFGLWWLLWTGCSRCNTLGVCVV